MKVVMISAPYSSVPPIVRDRIKQIVEHAARVLWKNGVACVAPHLNSWNFTQDGSSEDVFHVGYEEIARRCDAILVVSMGKESEGVAREVHAAKKVFLYVEDVVRWASENGKGGEGTVVGPTVGKREN